LVSFISERSSAYKGINEKGKKYLTPKTQQCRKKGVMLPLTAHASYLPVNEFFASPREREETVLDLSLQRPEYPLQKGNPTGSDLRSSFNLPQAQT